MSTYRRTAQELERMMEIFGGEPDYCSKESESEESTGSAAETAATADENENEDESVGETVFDKEFNETI